MLNFYGFSECTQYDINTDSESAESYSEAPEQYSSPTTLIIKNTPFHKKLETKLQT